GVVLAISFKMGAKAKSAKGYFAAHGEIGWVVNGVSCAGDCVSAASFLCIFGMIAFYGYDGFLYSIGYLAGWVVALFVIAEPIKRLGRYTFADALDHSFQSRGIKLVAALSTLVVSLFYLIPQMVGAGGLIRPLLGLPHSAGVVLVGAVVVLIVATAGMTSTTYVQFIKGALLLIFSVILTVLILQRGFKVETSPTAMTPQTVTVTPDGKRLINQGQPDQGQLRGVGHVLRLPGDLLATGQLGPLSFLVVLRESDLILFETETIQNESGTTTIFKPRVTRGADVLRPGNSPTFKGLQSDPPAARWNFVSLMLAL